MTLRAALAPALLAALAACSARQVVSQDFVLCRKGACRPAAGGTREELARAVYALMRSASGRDLVLSEEKSGAAASRGRGIRVFT